MGTALAALFFTVVAVWLTWPLVARLGTGLNAAPDPLLNYWTMAWSFHTLARDPLALFDANIFYPRQDTLAYSEHLFGVTLISWPAYLMSGKVLVAYNFAMAASFILSGLGMYLLVMEITGTRWAALLAGIAYMAAPYRFLHLYHLQLLSAQWFPFVFFYLYRFLRDGRTRQVAAVALFTLLQALSCNYYALYLAFALLLFGLLLLVKALTAPRLLSVKKAALLLVSASIVFLAALPFALPYERNRKEKGFYRRYDDVVSFSAKPLDYTRPSAFNKVFWVDYLPRQDRSESALFPGISLFLFAGMGLVLGRRHIRDGHEFEEGREMMWLFFAALTVTSFVLSLGPEIELGEKTVHLPYRAFYRHLPGFRGLRVPARMAILVLVGLSTLAGWGLSWLLRRAGRWGPWLGGLVVAFALFEYQTYSLARILPPAPRVPPVYQWFNNQPGDFGVLELPMHDDITQEAVRMYHSTTHWKSLANGFSGWWPNDYWVLVGRMRHFPTYRILRFLERTAPVRYIIIHYDKYPERRRQRLRQDMIRYRNRLPLRARFGSDAVHELLPDTVKEE